MGNTGATGERSSRNLVRVPSARLAMKPFGDGVDGGDPGGTGAGGPGAGSCGFDSDTMNEFHYAYPSRLPARRVNQ